MIQTNSKMNTYTYIRQSELNYLIRHTCNNAETRITETIYIDTMNK